MAVEAVREDKAAPVVREDKVDPVVREDRVDPGKRGNPVGNKAVPETDRGDLKGKVDHHQGKVGRRLRSEIDSLRFPVKQECDAVVAAQRRFVAQ